MTPFEKAGYTENTTFRALVEYEGVGVGDIVTVYKDDGSIHPLFESEEGKLGTMFLPQYGNDLEVYSDNVDINYLKLNTDINGVLESHGISLLELTLILNSDNLNQ